MAQGIRYHLTRSLIVGERDLSLQSLILPRVSWAFNLQLKMRWKLTTSFVKRLLQKPPATSRQAESARLLKLVPDLSQKEMSRLVGAIIKRQKRDAPSTTRKTVSRRERAVSSSVTALDPDNSDATPSQTTRVEMPARSAALTKQDALRMLQESRFEANPTTSYRPQPASTGGQQRRDLAEELIHRASHR